GWKISIVGRWSTVTNSRSNGKRGGLGPSSTPCAVTTEEVLTQENRGESLWQQLNRRWTMKCQRCCRDDASYRVWSDVIDMKVCAVCVDEGRRLGIAVEVLGGAGRKDDEEKKDVKLVDYRSELLSDCGR